MRFADPDKEIERLRELLRSNQERARRDRARADSCQAYAEQMRRLAVDLSGMLAESRKLERLTSKALDALLDYVTKRVDKGEEPK